MMGIVKNLSKEFHFDILLFTSEIRHYENEFLKYGGKIFRIPYYEGHIGLRRRADSYLRDYKMYRDCKKLLKNEMPYDVIHCNNEFESAPILKAAYECGIPIRICHTHVVHMPGNPLINIINHLRAKQICKYATAQIGCSEEANHSIYLEKTSCKVVPNFYDEDKFKYSDGNSSALANHIVISHVGAYAVNKNQLFSIKIAEELVRKGLSVQLNLIGFDLEQSYRDQLDKYLKDNSLSEYINLIPGDRDFTSILNESHCFLMPSIREGFGISLIEAQAVGLHCFASANIPISTNCGGVDFISLDDSPKAWANQILHWFQRTKGRRNSRYDTFKFKSKNVMNQYRILYSCKDVQENSNSR